MVSYLSHLIKMGPLPLTVFCIKMEMADRAGLELARGIYKGCWKGESSASSEHYRRCGKFATDALVMTLLSRLKYGNVIAFAGLLSFTRWTDPGRTSSFSSSSTKWNPTTRNYWMVKGLDAAIPTFPSLPQSIKDIRAGSTQSLSPIERFITDCRHEILQAGLLAFAGIALFQRITGHMPTHISYGGLRLL